MSEVFENIKKDNQLFISSFEKLVSNTIKSGFEPFKLVSKIEGIIEKEYSYQKEIRNLHISDRSGYEKSVVSFIDSKEQIWYFEINGHEVLFTELCKEYPEENIVIEYRKNKTIIVTYNNEKPFKHIINSGEINKELSDLLSLTIDIDISKLIEPINQTIIFPKPEMLNFINEIPPKKLKNNFLKIKNFFKK